jgi:ribonuclease Z
LKITMLGTGAALPDPDRCQTSILITLDNGEHYLLDCGHGATRQMVRANVSPADVGRVFLTHLHHDHIAELPYFLISGWMLNRVGSPLIVGPPGTARFVEHFVENGAFQVDFRARSHYPARVANIEAMRPQVREYQTEGVIHEDEHLRITAFEVDHIEREIARCYGLRIEAEGKVVAFSGDTKPCRGAEKLAQDADLLIHECTFSEEVMEHRRKSGVGTVAHTSPLELGRLAASANVKSLVATHIGHMDSLSPVLKRAALNHMPVGMMGPHQLDAMVADIRRDYDGPLRIAHDLMRIDL